MKWLFPFSFILFIGSSLFSQCENEIEQITKPSDSQLTGSGHNLSDTVIAYKTNPNQSYLRYSVPNPILGFSINCSAADLPSGTLADTRNYLDKCDSLKRAAINNPPKMIVFWEFSDGCYFRTIMDSLNGAHTFNPRRGINGLIPSIGILQAKGTPTYSDSEEPKSVIIDTISINNSVSSNNINSVFTNEDTITMKLYPSFNAVTKRDTFTIAISYVNGFLLDRNGKIKISYPSGLTMVRLRTYDQNLGLTQNSTSIDTLKEWQLNNIPSGQQGTFFADFAVEDTLLAGLEPKVYDKEFNIDFEIEWEEDSRLNDLIGLESNPRANPNNPNNIPFDSIPILTNTNQNQAISLIEYQNLTQKGIFKLGNFNQKASLFMRANKARDPNLMTVWPRKIYPGKRDVGFEFRVYFQNESDAPAYEVRVNPEIENSGKLIGFSGIGKTNPASFNKVDQTDFGTPFMPKFLMTSTMIPHDELGFAETDYVKFNMKTNPNFKFKVGQKINAKALVEFLSQSGIEDTLTTNSVFIEVVKRYKLPCYWGVKAGINSGSNGFEKTLTNFPLNGALTLRKALEKKNKPYLDYVDQTGFIKLNDFSTNWLQGELGISRLVFDGSENRFSYLNIELPIQFEKLIGKLPKFKEHSIAISAGYMPSFHIRTDKNNQKQKMKFGERFEHNAVMDISIGNIIGSPGISLGMRYIERLKKTYSLDLNERYFQVFSHLNF